jgi:hypothetical protein
MGGKLPVRHALRFREATVKVYGVAVAIPQGQSRVPHPSTERQ